MARKIPMARTRRVAIANSAGDAPTVKLSQLVDSNGNPLTDADLLNSMAGDAKTIQGVPADNIFTKSGMLRPALLRQVFGSFTQSTTKNLVPDSDAKFGTVYWTLSGLSITANDGSLGGNGFSFVGTGAASGTKKATSTAISVKAGTNITVSGSLNGVFCSGALPQVQLWNTGLTTMYGSVNGVLGQDQRVSFTLTVPGGVTQVVLVFTSNNTTVSNGNKLAFSQPQVEVGTMAGPYKANTADDATGYLKAGASQIDLASGIHLNKILDNVADGTTYARIKGTELSSGVHKLSVVGSGAQLGDNRQIKAMLGLGPGMVANASFLTASSAGTISVNATSLSIGVPNVSYAAAVNISTGLPGGSTWYVSSVDPNYAGGSIGWGAYSSAHSAYAADNGTVAAGNITIPTSGSTNGGAGSQCVHANSWMADGRQAKAVRWFTTLLDGHGRSHMVRPTAGEFLKHLWKLVTGDWHRLFMPEMSSQPCVEIIAKNGCRLLCSISTPFTLRDGSCGWARDMYRQEVMTPHGWSKVIDVRSRGLREVVHIHLGGHSFAAGLRRNQWVESHNVYKP